VIAAEFYVHETGNIVTGLGVLVIGNALNK
jgi:hypothetical protein